MTSPRGRVGVHAAASLSRNASRRQAGRGAPRQTRWRAHPAGAAGKICCAGWPGGANGATSFAYRGSSAISRSRRVRPLRSERAASASIFIFAMSTPVGHSRRHALQETHSDIASATASRRHRTGAELPGQRQPQRVGPPARHVRLVARHAIRWAHHAGIEARQVPLLLHISTAPSMPPSGPGWSDQSSFGVKWGSGA